MSHAWLIAGLALAAVAQQQQQQQQAPVAERDLQLKRVAEPGELKGEVKVPRGYAIVIGVGKYKNLAPEQNLRFAESDAEAVARVLMSKEGGNIEPENLKKLIGAKATLAEITQQIEQWLPATVQPEDRVIVYFVGHGVVAGGRGYFAPYDIELGRIPETGYPMARLGQVMADKVRAQWKMLLVDACHSGKVTAESTQESIYSEVARLPKNFLTMTSSTEQESSYEDPNLGTGFGLFTYYLIQGWQGNADVDPRDGIVNADELVEYVRSLVRSHARRKGVYQTPRERGDWPPDMLLGYSPRRRAQLAGATPPALATANLVIEADKDEVEVYLDDKLVGKVNAGQKLTLPGLAAGPHVVRGVRRGFDPVVKEIVVVPGQDQTVTLRIQYAVQIKKSARELYDKGFEIYRRRKSDQDWREAGQLFAAALKEDDRYSEAALQLCRVYQALGQTAEATKACKRAIERDPDYVDARTQYGAMLVESGDAAEAIRQLSVAAQQNTTDPFVYSLLAESYLRLNRYPQALEAAGKSVEVSDRHAFGYLVRGDANRYLKKYAEAVDDYRKYLELDNFQASVKEWIPYLLIGHGFSKRNAGFKLNYALQRASAFFGLCYCEIQRENVLRGSQWCEKAIALDRNDSYSWNLLGTAYLDLFNRDNRKEYLVKAETNIRKALQLNPDAEFATEAKSNLKQIREILPQLR
ncbi:MAG: caspase family protein [Bryobacterales bacterium]|nr:caspase family protein [Bryobacterales bacterium]